MTLKVLLRPDDRIELAERLKDIEFDAELRKTMKSGTNALVRPGPMILADEGAGEARVNGIQDAK